MKIQFSISYEIPTTALPGGVELAAVKSKLAIHWYDVKPPSMCSEYGTYNWMSALFMVLTWTKWALPTVNIAI